MNAKMKRFNLAVENFDRATLYHHDRMDVWQMVSYCERKAEQSPVLPCLRGFSAGFWYRLALEIQESHKEILSLNNVKPI